MSTLRCSKCGSDSGFMLQTHGGKTLEVSRPLPLDRIRASVLVTCTYCNYKWDQVPIRITMPDLDERVHAASNVAQH